MSSSDDGQKRRIAIIAVCSCLLVAMVIAVTVGVSINGTNSDEETNNGSKNSQVSSSMKAIKSICQPTDFKKTCEEQLRAEAGDTSDVKQLVQAAFKAAMKFASQAVKNSTTLRDLEKDQRSKKALDVCKQLMTYSIHELQKSLNQIDKLDITTFDKMLSDVKIWLSATISNQQTCLDGFSNTTTHTGEKMKKALNISMQLSRNGLAIATEMADVLKQMEIQGISRRLLQKDELVVGHDDWLSMLDKRRLLQEKEPPVVGHDNWFSMLDKRRLLQEKEPPVVGHDNWFSMLDKRRLLQEKEQPVVGHDNWFSMLDKRRLLQEKEPPVVGHDGWFSMLDKRRLLQEKEPLVIGHDDWSSMLDKHPLLQEKEPPVVGHDSWSSMLDKRRLLQEKELLVVGHDDWSSLLDKRRLLQEKKPPVVGHDSWSSLLDKRRLLQEKEPLVVGHDDWSSMLDKRRLLQEKEPLVVGHDDWSSMLDKRRLLQEKEPPVVDHDDWSSMLAERSLLQEKQPPVVGHNDWSSMLDKRRLLQRKEPLVVGHDDWYSMLDKRRLLQEKEPLVVGHDDWSSMLDKRRLLQEKEPLVAGHDDWSSMLDKHRLLQEKEIPVIGHADWSFIVENNPWKRRLMAAAPSSIKADIIVAKDGSGNFTTIKDAINAIPLNSIKPFVLHIKEGIYQENLEFGYKMTNVALIGDGKEKTRITGHLNNADGVPTFRTATVAVNGDNFFAKNIGFENSAGPAKFQAVALMVLSDFAVLYNCSMDGYQDTLYVHSKRQFYRDCTISGTIDFVFGDAAAVFQNCTFVVRKPLNGQQNIVTAQGRMDVRQPTGIVIQNSTFVADPELVPVKDKHPTYLGRPWGNFSRTIIMESYLDDLIKPEGWTIWDGPWGLKTCFYSEFNNHGPGSSQTARVTWPGIKKITRTTAIGYTPGKFFNGDSWIRSTRVPYTSGFTKSNTRNVGLHVRSGSI